MVPLLLVKTHSHKCWTVLNFPWIFVKLKTALYYVFTAMVLHVQCERFCVMHGNFECLAIDAAL